MWFFKLAKECRTCGHLVALGRGKKVDDARVYFEESPLFYCEGCAPPYDKVFQQSLTGKCTFYKTNPAQEVQVTEKGELIKVKEIKK